MKSPLKRLAVGAQPTVASTWSARLDWDRIARARRKAGIATAVAAVVAAGTASSLFVDYLADRAIERSASLARLAATQTQVAASEPMESMLPETTTVATPVSAEAAAPVRQAPVAKSAARTPVAPVRATAASAGARPERSVDPATGGEQILAYDGGDDGMDSPSPAEMAAERLAGDDRMFTSSIPLPDTAPPPVPNPAADKPGAIKVSAAAGAASTGGQPGRVTRDVTMRSGPAKRAGQIAVVPAKSPISVLGCKAWCEIVYNGKKGFVYKSFVRKT